MKQILSTRKDVVFYIKLFPLVQIHKDAFAKSKAIVCEKLANGDEKALQMLEDAFGQKPLPEPTCETDAIEKSMEVGKSLGLRGTPAIIFQDGSIIKGAASPEQILEKIDNVK